MDWGSNDVGLGIKILPDEYIKLNITDHAYNFLCDIEKKNLVHLTLRESPLWKL